MRVLDSLFLAKFDEDASVRLKQFFSLVIIRAIIFVVLAIFAIISLTYNIIVAKVFLIIELFLVVITAIDFIRSRSRLSIFSIKTTTVSLVFSIVISAISMLILISFHVNQDYRVLLIVSAFAFVISYPLPIIITAFSWGIIGTAANEVLKRIINEKEQLFLDLKYAEETEKSDNIDLSQKDHLLLQKVFIHQKIIYLTLEEQKLKSEQILTLKGIVASIVFGVLDYAIAKIIAWVFSSIT